MNLAKLKEYELVEQHTLSDLNSEGMVFRHKKSGARIAVISNDDDNKVFFIGFRTPAEDSTGVPHIIEHTVLCGSKNYPVKDPFIELAKGSLNTFLNAMTFPDKTIYPVASCNDKDFQNLMSVYMDAVFYPNIYKYEEIFKQEGWHYELEDIDSPIMINGVVYNEMKGAFSSADDVLSRQILNSLFPDTCYANESGGDPECIPELTYEAYLDFHRRYYHPSNSYIYLYGDMDVEEKLQWLDEAYLSHYEQIETNSEIGTQQAFDEPVEVYKKYSISSSEPEENNTYLSYNLVLGTTLDEKLYQAFDILDYALVGAPGAPIKKALTDAGIGSEISGGYDSSIKQPTFSIIAKNANTSDKEQFLAIIREVLEKLVKDGLNKKSLLAGINSSEFRYREADYGSSPKGLLYGIQCLESWLYDDSKVFLHLEANAVYAYLREQVETNYFEELIQKYFLDNTHASVVIVEPERGLNAKMEAALEARLKDYKESLSAEEIDALIEATNHLEQYQEEPSSKEDMEKIPMLTREDMKKEAQPFSNKERQVAGTMVMHHDIFSNGIIYLALLFNMQDIPEEDIPYIGILKAMLGYVDTANYNYADFANEVNFHTGGVGSTMGLYPSIQDKDDIKVMFEVRTKALADKLVDARELLEEMMLTSNFTDEKRLREVLLELKSRLQMTLSGAGHSVASTRAMSYFSKTAVYRNSIELYRVVADLETNFEERKVELAKKLQALTEKIFTNDRLMVSVTCSEEDYAIAEQEIAIIKEKLFADKGIGAEVEFTFEQKNEGFMDASQVQYVARAGNYRKHGFDYHGALRILKVILGYDYLWNNVRVKGGAYGCMNGCMRNGDMYFVSYRDPNLSKTNEVYDGIPAYIESFEADEHEMTKYIIGTISDMDTPMNPFAKGERSMTAYLQGLSFEKVQKEREQVIGAIDADIRELKELVASVLEERNICVVGNEEMLQKEAELFKELLNLY
ncbi:MAG: insulinase family protein [Roseburia sp.]|nr:insulinase family protein [Roseburia sp.]